MICTSQQNSILGVLFRTKHRQITWLCRSSFTPGLTNGKKFFLMKKFSSKSVTRLWKPFALLLKMTMIPLQVKTIRNHLVHVDRRSKTPGQWESADTKCKSKSKHIFIFVFNDFSRVKEWWCLKQQWHTFKVFKSCHQGCVTWKITHNLFWGKRTSQKGDDHQIWIF